MISSPYCALSRVCLRFFVSAFCANFPFFEKAIKGAPSASKVVNIAGLRVIPSIIVPVATKIIPA